jgi:hypothetical protein
MQKAVYVSIVHADLRVRPLEKGSIWKPAFA